MPPEADERAALAELSDDDRRTEYVSRDFVRDVRREVANYTRFKELTAEWIDLSIELSRLRMTAAAGKT